MTELFAKLARPFAPDEIEWRAGATNRDKTKALALAYITSRAVMDRLDEVCGPEQWQDSYAPGPNGGVICGLSIHTETGWITKWDGADNSAIEGVKGGLSDAFKRAAVKWGIGRYLYRLPASWVACEQRGKSVVLTGRPGLPKWALPDPTDEYRPDVQHPDPPGLPERATKIDRPYPPEETRKRLLELADMGREPTEGQEKMLAPNLEGLFSTQKEDKRHAVTEYVFGVSSTKDLTPGQKYALTKWMNYRERDDDWLPDFHTIHEAEAIYTAQMKDSGQKNMFEEEGNERRH